MNSKMIAKIGIIAALYAVITIILAPISFGGIQIRISEALTLLPFFMGFKAVIGLWLGCMIANVYGGLGLIDIIFGALLTLIAGFFTARSSTIYKAGIYPVIFNAFGVALILKLVLDLPYFITAFYIGMGQFISVYMIGIPLMKLIDKRINLND
jgi:uncharacterized membrane protein